MSRRCWGSDFQPRESPRELLTPHPAVPGSSPFPHHSSCLLALAAAWERDTGLDPVGNVGRVWAERRKGPALTLGCKSESHHTWLPSNAQDTRTQGVPSSPARAAPSLVYLGALLCSPHADTSSLPRAAPLGNHLLLPLLCSQGPSRNASCFSPNLPQTRPPPAPRQDGSQTLAPGTTGAPPRRAPVTKQQRGQILGFLRILGYLAGASRPQKPPAANPARAAPALSPLSPRRSHAVTGWHCASAAAQLHPHPPPLPRGVRENPGLGPGSSHHRHPRMAATPFGHSKMPGDPGSPQGGDPRAQTQAPAAFPRYGYSFITMAKGDQLHLYNIPLHKTNRPGNWDSAVKYFIVWTRGVRAAAHGPSRPQIPGIPVLLLPAGLGAG